MSAQAKIVSASNHPLFLLSQAVTGTPPPATVIAGGGRSSWQHKSQAILKPSKTVNLWFGLQPLENNLAAFETAPNAIACFDFFLMPLMRHPLRDVPANLLAGTLITYMVRS